MRQKRLFGGEEPAKAPAAARTLSMFDAQAMAPVRVDLRLTEIPPLSGLPLFRGKTVLPPPAELLEVAQANKPRSRLRRVMREAQTLRANLKKCQLALAECKKPCGCASKKKKPGPCACKGH